MESIFESYELYDWNKIQSKIEKYIESKPLLRKCLHDFEKDLKSYKSCAKKRSTLNNIAAIVPIRDLSRFRSLDEALLSTWKVYKLLPNEGIRNEAVKKQLFDAVNKTLSLPENVLNHLKESPYANYVFLELIRKSQVFKCGYEIENDEIDDEEIDDEEIDDDEIDDEEIDDDEVENEEADDEEDEDDKRLNMVEFFNKLNRYALEKKVLNNKKININQFQFILNTPKEEIKYFSPWDNLKSPVSSSFYLNNNIQKTNIRFTHVIHVTHIETFKKMCKVKSGDLLTIEFKGNSNYYFQGLELIWFSVCPLDKHFNDSPALDAENSRYGNIGIKIPFQTLLDQNPHCFSLGTRVFKREHEHAILMSHIEVTANLNEMKIYPKIDLDKSQILRKGENKEFIWKNSRLHGTYDDKWDWDNLTFCIARPKIEINVNMKNDIVVFNHKNQLCISKINKGFDCDQLDKNEAKKNLKNEFFWMEGNIY